MVAHASPGLLQHAISGSGLEEHTEVSFGAECSHMSSNGHNQRAKLLADLSLIISAHPTKSVRTCSGSPQ